MHVCMMDVCVRVNVCVLFMCKYAYVYASILCCARSAFRGWWSFWCWIVTRHGWKPDGLGTRDTQAFMALVD